MAVVYLARDLKHDRPVAIKVLRQELAASVGAARFLREIGIAAQLQHPNILPLLDSGEEDGQLYFVMPFIDGESLRQRLVRVGQLSVSEAVRVLQEVVDALAYAHQRGIVHRDIKPDNVLMSGKHALVTDFGVARAITAATGDHTLTSMGMALGTPMYMAPEQVAADPNVDQRADIYSVGIMAYELLTGRTPFAGQTPQRVLASHVTATPEPVGTLRTGLPPMLQHAVMRCLEKRPEDRWQSADELLAEFESLAFSSGGSSIVAALATPVIAWWRRPATVALLLVGAIAFALGARQLLVPRFAGGRAAATLTVGSARQFTTDDGLEMQPDISPDGNTVAYAQGNSARMRIFIRPVGGGRTIALSDDSASVETQPRWSPDGSQLLFLSHRDVRVGSALGGESRRVVSGTARDSVKSATWSPDGRSLAFSRADSLLIVSLVDSSMRFIGTAAELHSCAWSPKRSLIACVSGNLANVVPGTTFGNIAPSAILVFPATGGAPVVVAELLSVNQSPVWSQDGQVLYFMSDRQGTRDIYSVQVGGDGHARGQPVRETTGLGVHSFALSRDGRHLAYAVYTDRANVWSLPILSTPEASFAAMAPVTRENQVIEGMRLSRNGRWLVYDSNISGHAEIYRVRVPSGAPERVTNSPNAIYRADLSPDERELVYQSRTTGSRDIFVQPVDGGAATIVVATPAQEVGPTWSPTGHAVAFVHLTGDRAVFVVRRDANGRWNAPQLRGVIADPSTPDWSPDGRDVVFTYAGTIHAAAADSGSDRILYAPSSGEPGAEQVVFSHDGTTLYFKSHDAAGRASFWSLAVSGGRPRLLARLSDLTHPSYRPDFATDGKRLYFASQERQSDIWIADVTRR